jgi:hypothetical protein
MDSLILTIAPNGHTISRTPVGKSEGRLQASVTCLKEMRVPRYSAEAIVFRYKRSVPLPIPVISLFCSRSIPKIWVYAQKGNNRRPTLIEDI